MRAYEFESQDLPSVERARRAIPQILARAQQDYDAWDEEDRDTYAGGGICHIIADSVCDVLSDAGIECTPVSCSYEQHVYVAARFAEGIYTIDIPYHIYEQGRGFSWKKLPDVRFEPRDVVFYRVSGDPADWRDYLDEGMRDVVNFMRNIGSDRDAPIVMMTNPQNTGARTLSGQRMRIEDFPLKTVAVSELRPWEPMIKMRDLPSQRTVASLIQTLQRGDRIPPLLVTPVRGGYRIIDGHHRYAALQRAGVDQVPVRVVDPRLIRYSDEVMEALNITLERYGHLGAPGVTEGRETITLKKPFHKKVVVDNIELIARSSGNNDLNVTAFSASEPGDTPIAQAKFWKEGSHLFSEKTFVSQSHQRKGIATLLYQFVKSLGFDIQPSKEKTELGQALWRGFTSKDSLSKKSIARKFKPDVAEAQGEIKLGPQLFVSRQTTTEDIKPRGVAWTSTAQKTPQGFTSDWVEWCKDNMAQWVTDTGILYDVAPGARILLVRTDRDVIRVARRYGLEIKNSFDLFEKMDWDVLRQDYDAVHHIPQGRDPFMSAWDVESTAWFDRKFLTNPRRVTIDTGKTQSGRKMHTQRMAEGIDPNTFEELDARIIARAAKQIVPTARARRTPDGYVHVTTEDGLDLYIGAGVADGVISVNIGSGGRVTTSGAHKGAVTDIIRSVYLAAVRKYGEPDTPGELTIDHDAGHGVWQHIADKLGLRYAAVEVKESGMAEGSLSESAYEEAWELISQPVPEIQQFVQQLGLSKDDATAKQIAPMIDAAPDTQIPAASISKLKNLANKGNDVQTLKAIQQISGRPDAAQQYAKLMQARDAGEGRNRGYNVSGLIKSVQSGNYEAPVLLKLPTGLYVIGGRTRLYAALALGIDAKVKIISANNFKQGVAEGRIINTHLWHGSRNKHEVLEPRQAIDTGGAAGSNQNAIYATSDPKVAIAMGLTTPGSDTGMFPNDPQMVLFSGKIRKGEYVYLHRLPINGPDGKPQFVQGGNSREFHSIPGVQGIKPIEIKEIPVNRYLSLIRKATREDWALRKKFMKKQGVAEGRISDLDIDLQDQQWDSVVGRVEHGVRRGEDPDRMSLALYRWATAEMFDMDEELERRGFGSVADLADHIRDHGGRYVPPEFDLGAAGSIKDIQRLPRRRPDDVSEATSEPDFMRGHCHVMALALLTLHPDWQLRAHIGWEDDAESDSDYRVDHVYVMAPDGTAYDCRGRFASEQELVGPDETGGAETQFVDYDISRVRADVARGELRPFGRRDLEQARAFAQRIDENFADGKVKGKSRPGRVRRAGASCKGSVTDLRARARKYGGERGKMYHWCANMKSGAKNS